VHVILGGRAKGESFEPLVAAIGTNVRGAYLIGEAADALAAALEPGGVAIRRCGDLERAVAAAAAAAAPGDVVLLSPACASFDQFADFEERGEEFRRLVRNLEG
jgi:UDP-N-acetylmuramoylalanine--D-glutamate ligase